MQSRILAANPHARLRVYALWTDKLFGDARNRWDAAGLTDPRVTHLWDGPDLAGDWLAGNTPGYQGSDWDTYLLFGPEATWTTRPTPLRGWGGPVDEHVDDLDRALRPLLATR
ncbi:MAG TPA: hypothetical protein VEP73_10975 [Actinomycetota bacterium]|nr:hypothetical protein [Actinomycetota bacterium]